jgi:ENTH domain
MSLKHETYKMSTLSNFYFQEGGKDQGQFIREKVSLICDLLGSEQQLIQERAEAFEYRKKFYPGTGPNAEQAGITNPGSAFSGLSFST